MFPVLAKFTPTQGLYVYMNIYVYILYVCIYVYIYKYSAMCFALKIYKQKHSSISNSINVTPIANVVSSK